MQSMKHELPRMCLPLDFRWDDFEWEFPPIKLPKGWKNRQLKRVNRIAEQIADEDRRALETERERARLLGIEIQRDLELQVEKDRRLEEFQQALKQAEIDREKDDALTEKYLSRIAKATEKRRKRDAEWTANAVRRLREVEKEMLASDIRYVQRERAELLRRGVLCGLGPKPVTFRGRLGD
jgi:hypothetical protein